MLVNENDRADDDYVDDDSAEEDDDITPSFPVFQENRMYRKKWGIVNVFVLNVPFNNYSHKLTDSISYYTVPKMAGLKRFTCVKYAGLPVLSIRSSISMYKYLNQ